MEINLHGSKDPVCAIKVEKAKDNLDCGIGFGFEQSNFGLTTQFKCPLKIICMHLNLVDVR